MQVLHLNYYYDSCVTYSLSVRKNLMTHNSLLKINRKEILDSLSHRVSGYIGTHNSKCFLISLPTRHAIIPLYCSTFNPVESPTTFTFLCHHAKGNKMFPLPSPSFTTLVVSFLFRLSKYRTDSDTKFMA